MISLIALYTMEPFILNPEHIVQSTFTLVVQISRPCPFETTTPTFTNGPLLCDQEEVEREYS